MSHCEVREDHDVDGVGSVAEVGADSFLDVAMELVQRSTLREYVLAQPAGAPVLAVEVGFHLDQHGSNILHSPQRGNVRVPEALLDALRQRTKSLPL